MSDPIDDNQCHKHWKHLQQLPIQYQCKYLLVDHQYQFCMEHVRVYFNGKYSAYWKNVDTSIRRQSLTIKNNYYVTSDSSVFMSLVTFVRVVLLAGDLPWWSSMQTMQTTQSGSKQQATSITIIRNQFKHNEWWMSPLVVYVIPSVEAFMCKNRVFN